MRLNCAGKILDLSTPKVMGILNVTPDSFSDAGCFFDRDTAIRHATQMIADGANIIDIGGESTRPGAEEISINQELDRVIPVIEALQQSANVPISIDTSKPAVMCAAVDAGAGFINDVRALQLPGALEAARDCGVPICLMHMQGEPCNMQDSPHYDDLIAEINTFLVDRIQACVAGGIMREQLMIDPGFGFGKTVSHNLHLLHSLQELQAMNAPLLIGVSRKSTIADVLQRSANECLAGSLALTAWAVIKGARIIRAHDVKETVDTVKMVVAVMHAKSTRK